MPVLRVCGCGHLTPTTPCDQCKAKHGAHKRAKRKASGYDSKHWQRLRIAALNRDGHICQDCGQQATTVHVKPELLANHWAATLDDCLSLCASCHARRDSKRRHAHLRFDDSMPQPR